MKNGKALLAVAVGMAVGTGVYRKTKHIQEKARRKGTHVPYGPYEAFLKRPLDVVLSLTAIIVLSPVFFVTALLVKIKLGNPVIFTQERPGKIDEKTGQEKIFKLYKFRTMTNERDENNNLLPAAARLTKFGIFLRSASLDELLELINIVKGDMAIIGPRPLLVQYLPYYTAMEKHRHDVRPGLSGFAQVNGRNAIKWDKRLEYDVNYVRKISFLRDLKIILLNLPRSVTTGFNHIELSIGSIGNPVLFYINALFRKRLYFDFIGTGSLCFYFEFW